MAPEPEGGACIDVAAGPESKMATSAGLKPGWDTMGRAVPARTTSQVNTRLARGSGSSIRYSEYRPSLTERLASGGGGSRDGWISHSTPNSRSTAGSSDWNVAEL